MANANDRRQNPENRGPAAGQAPGPSAVSGAPVTVLVCACGKRLRAPGAVPGRVGMCPACGAELKVPEPQPAPVAQEIHDEGSRFVAPPEGVRPERKKRRPKSPDYQTDIWNGLIRAPRSPEKTLRESLLYPLWGSSGVALLVLLPPVLWLTSIPAVWASLALSSGLFRVGLGVLLVSLPFAIPFAAVFGFTLLYLGRVAATSAIGEVHHPRWPDWELSSIFFGLGRWLWAGLVGAAVGGFPAVGYWVYCGDIDLFDALILIELLAAGAVYGLMGLLASILYEDILAANPFTVIGAIRKVGWSYAQPCLVAGVAVVVAATVLAASFDVESPWLAAFLYWLFWFVALYEGMVVLRVLGLFYHRHARALGWFRGRTGWGV
jgi:hypothetical protein